MNTEEKLRRQLARYGGASKQQVDEEPEESQQPSSGGLWDFRLPDNWKPPVRYVSQEYAEDHSRNFKIGDLWVDVRPSGYVAGRHIQAIPRPKYSGKVGDVITEQMETEYDDEWQLWLTSSLKLEGCICTWHRILEFQDYWTNRPNREEMQKTFNEVWQWLCGLWASRNMVAPSMKDLEKWFRDWAARAEEQRK
jgi:hypothetical protein